MPRIIRIYIYFIFYTNTILQALPCTTAYIEATPELQTDHCMGMMVGTFPLNYKAFDDIIASGK